MYYYRRLAGKRDEPTMLRQKLIRHSIATKTTELSKGMPPIGACNQPSPLSYGLVLLLSLTPSVTLHAAKFIPAPIEVGEGYITDIAPDGSTIVGTYFKNSRPFRWSIDGDISDLHDARPYRESLTFSKDGSAVVWSNFSRCCEVEGSFVWTQQTGKTPLPIDGDWNDGFWETPLVTSLRGYETISSDASMIVGGWGEESVGGFKGGNQRPVRWTLQNGLEIGQPPSGYDYGQAVAISGDSMTIVVNAWNGHVGYPTSDSELFFWNPDGTMVSMDDNSPGELREVWGLSENGSIAFGEIGKSRSGRLRDASRLWRWTEDTGFADLDTGDDTYVYGVWNRGGLADDGSVIYGNRQLLGINGDLQPTEAFRWTEDEGFQKILLPGYQELSAVDMTPDGEWLLAVARRPDDSLAPAVELALYSRTTGLLRLSEILELQGLSVVFADFHMVDVYSGGFPTAFISADGKTIVGSSNTENGRRAWVIQLDPLLVPEPSSLLLLSAVAALGLVGRFRFGL